MKTKYFFAIIILLTTACNNRTKKQEVAEQHQDTAKAATDSPATLQQRDTTAVAQEVETFHFVPDTEKAADGAIVNSPDVAAESSELPDMPQPDPDVNEEHYRRRLNNRVYIEFSERPQNRVYVFYYTPGITNKDYPFLQQLGDDHNMMGYAFSGEKEMYVLVPDSIYPGSKLMFRSVGYEAYTVELDGFSGDCIPVQLTPRMYNTYVYLKRKNDKITVSSIYNESPFSTPFYGDCKPIYHFSEFGTMHSDPDCAFLCMGKCFPKFYLSQVKDILNKSNENLAVLYDALQNGQKCSFLFSSDKDGNMMISSDNIPDNLQNFSQLIRETKWSIESADGKVFQSRMNFLMAEN